MHVQAYVCMCVCACMHAFICVYVCACIFLFIRVWRCSFKLVHYTTASAAKITPLGRAMASFPVSPRYARMLAMGHQQGLLPYVIAAVAALSVDQLFIDTRASSDAATEASVAILKMAILLVTTENY